MIKIKTTASIYDVYASLYIYDQDKDDILVLGEIWSPTTDILQLVPEWAFIIELWRGKNFEDDDKERLSKILQYQDSERLCIDDDDQRRLIQDQVWRPLDQSFVEEKNKKISLF